MAQRSLASEYVVAADPSDDAEREMQERARRIMLALDRSAASRAAVVQTAALAELLGARVRISHIWDPGSGGRARLGARDALRQAAAVLRRNGVEVEEGQLIASRDGLGRDVAAAAREGGIDLVALGLDGAGDPGAILRGSAGQAVLSAVEQPVLVLRRGRSGFAPRRILVAAAAGGEERLAAAVALVALHDSEVTVLRVPTIAAGVDAPPVEPARWAAAVAEALAARIRRDGISATATVRWGPVAYTISETAKQAECDLIVLGSRPPSDMASLLLGSVAHQVIQKSDRAVLLAGGVGGRHPGTRNGARSAGAPGS